MTAHEPADLRDVVDAIEKMSQLLHDDIESLQRDVQRIHDELITQTVVLRSIDAEVVYK